MAVADEPDPLERVVRAAREEPLEAAAVEQVTRPVADRVRELAGRSTPLRVFTADGRPRLREDGAPVTVASRELRSTLRMVLTTLERVPSAIDLRIDDGRVGGVEVSIVARYGPDLREIGRAAGRDVFETVRSHLGHDPAFGPADVAVAVVDVVDGDPARD
ncbi:hypothetical protein [Nocardioides acrostichi]|uniref:Uncharacterized protein n=1 Tax=Nocardioides acrostichi TaxID=2784339 RepID=A0A930V0V0_9ACTN|nr:hypothetical protein [Nocardioides acrostichi]MBF4161657.1 hypothetical protein [Nocardioides acrostichi]